MHPVALRGLVGLAALLGIGACGGGGAGPAAASSTSSTSPTPVASEVARPSARDLTPATGEGLVVLGTDPAVAVDLDTCQLLADEAGQPRVLLAFAGSGSAADGTRLHVDAVRFEVDGAATTITDTVTIRIGDVDQPNAVVVAQRFEVDGLVSDGRDADADAPLFVVVGDTIRAEGIAAPPGNFAADGGLVGVAIAATCPPDRP